MKVTLNRWRHKSMVNNMDCHFEYMDKGLLTLLIIDGALLLKSILAYTTDKDNKNHQNPIF